MRFQSLGRVFRLKHRFTGRTEEKCPDGGIFQARGAFNIGEDGLLRP
jgi:hypothetical protein